MSKQCEICKGVGWVAGAQVTLDQSCNHTINYEVYKPCDCNTQTYNSNNKRKENNQDKQDYNSLKRYWWKD